MGCGNPRVAMIQLIVEDGTDIVAVEFNDDVEVVAFASRFAFDNGGVAVEQGEVVAVADTVEFNIDMGQKDGCGVAVGRTSVPFAKVRTRVSPLAPLGVARGKHR